MRAVCVCDGCLQKYLREYRVARIGETLAQTTGIAAKTIDLGEACSSYLQENIHLVWLGVFHDLFVSGSNISWELVPFDEHVDSSEGTCIWWGAEAAKDCGKIWTSISATATFWLCVKPDHGNNFCMWFSLAGQLCSSCFRILNTSDARNGNGYEKVSSTRLPNVQYGTWYPQEVARQTYSVVGSMQQSADEVEKSVAFGSDANHIYQILTGPSPIDFSAIFKVIKLPGGHLYRCQFKGDSLLHTLIRTTNSHLEKVLNASEKVQDSQQKEHKEQANSRKENSTNNYFTTDSGWKLQPVCRRGPLAALYRLAVSFEVPINAVNADGNTALHLAVLLPRTNWMVDHLLRLGADPSITNNHGIRVLIDEETKCARLARGFPSASGGIWHAVRKGDVAMVQSCLDRWYRVDFVSTYNDISGKSLRETVKAQGDYSLIIRTQRARQTNELVAAAMALDVPRVRSMLDDKFVYCDVNTCLPDAHLPRQLTAELHLWYGEEALPIIMLLQSQGAKGHKTYFDALEIRKTRFEESQLTKVIQKLDNFEDILVAKQIIMDASFDVRLKSHLDDSTYLHSLVKKYCELKKKPLVRSYLLQLMAKLAILGVDVNARDARGRTALVLGCELSENDCLLKDLLVKGSEQLEDRLFTSHSLCFKLPDQRLLNHLVRLGVDSSIGSPVGRYVAVEQFFPRGALRFCQLNGQIKGVSRAKHLPGIWPVLDAFLEHVQNPRTPDTNVSVHLRSLLRKQVIDYRVRILSKRGSFTPLKQIQDCFPTGNNAPEKRAQLKALIELLQPQIWTNECVLAAFADDGNYAKRCMAYGEGKDKMSQTVNNHFIGITSSGRATYSNRPIAIDIIEGGSGDIVSLLLTSGANIYNIYEEGPFCDMILFWAFQPHVPLETMYYVLEACAVDTRGLSGTGPLHALLRTARCYTQPWKNQSTFTEMGTRADWISLMIQRSLNRHVNIGWRDEDGNSISNLLLDKVLLPSDNLLLSVLETKGLHPAPKYLPEARLGVLSESGGNSWSPMALIDRHVANLLIEADTEYLGRLLFDGYDRLMQANSGPPTCRSAIDISANHTSPFCTDLVENYNQYRQSICQLHQAIADNDILPVQKMINQGSLKRGRDWRSRNILHIATISGHAQMAQIISENIPSLAYERDLLGYTPFHYALCLRDHRCTYNLLTANTPIDLSIRDRRGRSMQQFIEGIPKRDEIIRKELDAICPDRAWTAKLHRENTHSIASPQDQTADENKSTESIEQRILNEKLQAYHLPRTTAWPTSLAFPTPGAFYAAQRKVAVRPQLRF